MLVDAGFTPTACVEVSIFGIWTAS